MEKLNMSGSHKEEKLQEKNLTLEGGNLAAFQAFNADTAEPTWTDAQVSFKGELGPTLGDQEPQTS